MASLHVNIAYCGLRNGHQVLLPSCIVCTDEEKLNEWGQHKRYIHLSVEEFMSFCAIVWINHSPALSMG